jgi:hypothetical protein
MRKSHFNDDFIVLLGPIISRFFACSNEEKKSKQQRVHAIILSVCCTVLDLSPRHPTVEGSSPAYTINISQSSYDDHVTDACTINIINECK